MGKLSPQASKTIFFIVAVGLVLAGGVYFYLYNQPGLPVKEGTQQIAGLSPKINQLIEDLKSENQQKGMDAVRRLTELKGNSSATRRGIFSKSLRAKAKQSLIRRLLRHYVSRNDVEK